MTELESYFDNFRKNILGINQFFNTPQGEKKIVYADWTASGRLYGPIEERLTTEIFPFVGNTHTETSVTGSSMTLAYHNALESIKSHVNANHNDVIISSNSGMTGMVNKFQRILGLKIHEKYESRLEIPKEECPVVYITHMEHHSNQTSWLETICDVRIIQADKKGNVDLEHLKQMLDEVDDDRPKIAAITSCSNVTGIFTPYHEVASIMHAAGGLCFVDFACSAPYINVDMHPEKEDEALDAIYFSPHKFLGGPGTAGVLIFNQNLYKNEIPDNPGGGTVDWTNPWGEHRYIDDINAREDGGTPAFLQTIRTALCIKLKNQMGVSKMLAREKELLEIVFTRFEKISNSLVLAAEVKERLGVISFIIHDLHYNLGVKILNDRFGIQVRGGCSCAGTYGHILLSVDKKLSDSITCAIDTGDMSAKPGWIRMSIHPTMTNKEVEFIMEAITELAQNFKSWEKDYSYCPEANEFIYKEASFRNDLNEQVKGWLTRDLEAGPTAQGPFLKPIKDLVRTFFH